jgi:hypothetical protein
MSTAATSSSILQRFRVQAPDRTAADGAYTFNMNDVIAKRLL